ncbi:FUSC family protein [Salinifilum aidingensis]
MPRTVLLRDVRQTFRLAPAEATTWPAVRAGLAVLLPLLVLLATDRLDLMAGSLFGSFVTLHGRDEPYPRRARTLACVGLGLVASVAIGGLVSAAIADPVWREAVSAVALAAVAAAATAASNAVRLGPPGGLIFSFAVGACAHLPLTWPAFGQLVAVSLGSAVLGWSLCLSGALVDPFAPLRRAAGRTARQVAAHVDNGDERGWQSAAVAVRDAWHALSDSTRAQRSHPTFARLTRAVAACEAALTVPAPNPEVAQRLRELGRSPGRRGDTGPVGAGIVGTSGTGDTAAVDAAGTRASAARLPRRRVLRGAAAAVRGGRHHEWGWVLASGARVGVASLLAAGLANLLGTGHAYWAAVSAVAVLQVTSAARSLPRLLQRSTGTVLGVLIGACVLHLDPAAWVGVVLVAAFQWAAEMVVLRNYWMGVLFATPVALLAGTLPLPQAADGVAASRLLATVLGALVAIVVARALPNRTAAAARFERALHRLRRLLEDPAPDLGRITVALAELRDAHEALTGESARTREHEELLSSALRQASRRLDPGLAERHLPQPPRSGGTAEAGNRRVRPA